MKLLALFFRGNGGKIDTVSPASQIVLESLKTLQNKAVKFYRQFLQAFCRKLEKSRAIVRFQALKML